MSFDECKVVKFLVVYQHVDNSGSFSSLLCGGLRGRLELPGSAEVVSGQIDNTYRPLKFISGVAHEENEAEA